MPILDTTSCDSPLGQIFNPDCPGLFASDLDKAIFRASNGNLALYQQAKAQSDEEQGRLDATFWSDQLKTLEKTTGNIGGKVALGLGIGSGTAVVVAALAAFAYFKLQKAV